MMNFRQLALSGALAMMTSAANAASLDFEGILAMQGPLPGNTIVAPGVTVTLGGSGANTLGLYDSSCRGAGCTGGDSDLSTGSNIPGADDTPEENFVLISAEGSGSTFGDRVGRPIFTFTYDIPTFINSFVLVDIDEVATAVQAIFHFSDGSVDRFNGTNATSVINPGANNSHSTFDIATIAANLNMPQFLKPVDAFKIAFGQNDQGGNAQTISGAVASVSATPVPVPAALPLLASGLGLMGWLSRRRKAA
jgi:hypothetical protein